MKSHMVHSFSQVPKAEIPRSSFNRSYGLKTTFDSGYLIPVLVDEMLPGDTFNLKMSCFARLATPIVPFMDNMYLDVFFFSVPNRLLWQNWKKFNGEQANPGDSTSYLIPTVNFGGANPYIANGSIGDYFGLPTQVATGTINVSALPFRAYNLIWNEWFRDQNMQNSLVPYIGDGPEIPAAYGLLRRGKRHDYFTSALPFPQKGPAVTLPLGTAAPVVTNTAAIQWQTTLGTDRAIFAAAGNAVAYGGAVPGGNPPFIWGTQSGLVADLSNATAATINQLRQSFAVQKMYEKDARGGTRYTEVIRAHFGVTSPDARQQRPEYLGGGSFPININPVAQTSNTPTSGTPQGNLAAYGTVSAARGAGFSYSATEHCTLIGLVSARADLSYQQTVDRMWSRQTRFDFYWPSLSHIGEQSVLNKEIYPDGSANDNLTFGYQERYAEYRYKTSMITGQFRSNFAQTLDFWHLAQKFTTLPVLNSSFIQEQPPVARVIAVPSAPQFLFDSYFSYQCARPMPVYSVPGQIDRF